MSALREARRKSARRPVELFGDEGISAKAGNERLAIGDRSFIRIRTRLQQLDRFFRRGDCFLLIPHFSKNLRLLVLHEISLRILLDSLVYPFRRLRKVLILVEIEAGRAVIE